MADKTIYGRVKNLVKSASAWTTSNPTLLQGEVGFESDTGKAKLGDGTSAWNSLGYIKVSTIDNLTSTSTTDPLSANQGKLLKGLIDDRTPIATSVTIATADWSNYSCTKTVTGMTSDKAVIVTPSPLSMDNYVDASIKCTAQGTNSLTFTCSTVPSASITINILMMEVLPPPVLISLSVSGDWTNTQYSGESVDATGLTFTASYSNGSTKVVTPTSISPSTWSGTGSQTATFSYTEDGVTVSCTKTADVQGPRGYTVSFPDIINVNTYTGGKYIKFFFYDGTTSIYEGNYQIVTNLDGATINHVLSMELRSRDAEGSYQGTTLEPLSNFAFSEGITVNDGTRTFSSSTGNVGTITLNSNMTLTYLYMYSND